jgi:sec-independent protein translocase protein TatA
MGMIHGYELLLVLLVVVLLFGSKKIPELMKGLGSGLKEFKNASKDAENQINDKKQAESPDKGKNVQ